MPFSANGLDRDLCRLACRSGLPSKAGGCLPTKKVKVCAHTIRVIYIYIKYTWLYLFQNIPQSYLRPLDLYSFSPSFPWFEPRHERVEQRTLPCEQGHQSWARGNRTSTPPDCHRECHRVTSRRHRVQRVWKRPQLATGAELNTGVACTDLGHFKYISPGQKFPAWCYRPESFCCQFHPISAVELLAWKKILENWNCQLWHLFSKTVVIALAASSAGALHFADV